MINIYLPFTKMGEVYNSILYQQFFDENQHLSKFNENLILKGMYGSFPGALWNGGRPPSKEDSFNKEQIKLLIDFLNSNNIECRMTFTNCLLEEKHLGDPYCNTILDLMDNNKGNKIIINSQVLEDYIRQTHPNLGLISSITKGNTLDIFAENIVKPQYDLVVCYPKKNILEYIDKNVSIEDRGRIEVMLNSGCAYCKNGDQHYKIESYNNLYGEKKTMTCYRALPDYDRFKDEPLEEKLIFDFDYWNKLGLKHLKVQGRNVTAMRLKQDILDNLFYPISEDKIKVLEERLYI